MAGTILFLVSAAVVGGTGWAAFFWCVRTGQFRNQDSARRVIFDDTEPVGGSTDCFPDARARKAREKFLNQA